MNCQKILQNYHVLDFAYNSEKNLISLLTSNTHQLLRIKNENQQPQIKLIKSTPHHKYFRSFFNNKPSSTPTNLQLFHHHSIYKTDYYLHIDEDYNQCKQEINNIQIDSYGLVTYSSGNMITLCKYLTSYNNKNDFNLHTKKVKVNEENDSITSKISKKINVLAELAHHQQFGCVTSYYTKNSLLISGSQHGMMSLWDINKAKDIHNTVYLKYPVKNMGSFMNFKDINLYYANYKSSDKIVFCDIRTNKPIKIVNRFQGEIDCKMNKKGVLIGVNQNSIDFIDIVKGFKQFRIEMLNDDIGLQNIQNKRLLSNKKIYDQSEQKQNKILNVERGVKLKSDYFDNIIKNNSCIVKPFNNNNNNNDNEGEGYLNQYHHKITNSKFKKIVRNPYQNYKIRENHQKIVYNPVRVIKNSNGAIQTKKRLSSKRIFKNNLTQDAPQRAPTYHDTAKFITNKCCLLTQNEIYIANNQGWIQKLNHEKIYEYENGSDSMMKNLTKKYFKKFKLEEGAGGVMKLVEYFTGVYALSENGRVYKVNVL